MQQDQHFCNSMIEIVIYNIDNYCGKDGAIYMYTHPDPQVKNSTPDENAKLLKQSISSLQTTDNIKGGITQQ